VRPLCAREYDARDATTSKRITFIEFFIGDTLLVSIGNIASSTTYIKVKT
jgi:hypothetical protein